MSHLSRCPRKLDHYRILNVTPPSAATTLNPTCAVGLVVNVGQTCYYTDPMGSGGG